jgi:hypothetical protein
MAGRGATVRRWTSTRFLEQLAGDTVEVRRVDVRTGELPQREFDLVRPAGAGAPNDRRRILDRLAAALRPDGWLVIEDYDWTGFGFEDAASQSEQVTAAVIAVMARAGFDPRYGRRVVADMAAAGLSDVRGEGRALVIDSHSPGFDFFRLSF